MIQQQAITNLKSKYTAKWSINNSLCKEKCNIKEIKQLNKNYEYIIYN